jgi:uncharacterized protein YggL (DUF469 family)
LFSTIRSDLDVDRELKLRYGLVSHLAEQGMRCEGGLEGAWIYASDGRSLNDADREALRAWLSRQTDIVSAEIGPLVEC